MTTTELIDLLKKYEHGGASGRPREVMICVGDEIYDSNITGISTGDGLFAELFLEIDAHPERKTGRWIETEGLDEEIRCLMCTNHMRSDRGCDGACQYDEHVYKEIMSALERRMMEVEHEG